MRDRNRLANLFALARCGLFVLSGRMVGWKMSMHQKAMPFNSLCRQEIMDRLEGEQFDLLVIGGGVTGAGIALDAAVRGMKVALIEMQDFASGTSSRSTKLIHGGLRYLKQGEVRLVREVGRERAIVCANARHIVTPEWMLMPIVKGGTYGKLASSIGIYVYDLLAGVKREERRRMLGIQETLALEPQLRKEGLLGGAHYVEYRTDDARLTIEIVKAAAARGATAINYMEAKKLIYDDGGKICGVVAADRNGDRSFPIRAGRIVNAAGPWVDKLREMDGSKQGKRLHLTKGVHIVIDGSRLPLRQAVYFDTADGRMVFAIPRDGKTYVGTTDTNYSGDIAEPDIKEVDILYLLICANGMFPEANLEMADVESGYAGLRPLIHEDGKSPSELSRRDEIFVSPSGLVTIAGGKLTGYRKMAQRIVDLIAAQLAAKGGVVAYPPCSTDRVPLSGGEFAEAGGFESSMRELTERGQRLGLSAQAAGVLARRYGSNADGVFDRMDALRDDAARYSLEPEVLAALVYGIEEEMVARPLDFLSRRSSAVYFNRPNAIRWLEPVVSYMRDRFAWDEAAADKYSDEARHALHSARPFGDYGGGGVSTAAKLTAEDDSKADVNSMAETSAL